MTAEEKRTRQKRFFRAITNLDGNPNWQEIVQYLKDSASSIAGQSAYEESEAKTRWAQGRIQQLAELLKLIEQAKAHYKNIEKAERSPSAPGG